MYCGKRIKIEGHVKCRRKKNRMLPGKCARVRKGERVCHGGVNDKDLGRVYRKRENKKRGETERGK